MIAIRSDLIDSRLLRAAEADGGRVYLPLDLVKRMNAGEHPVRAWRAFRGLTLTALAAKAKLPVGYLSEIENRRKPGSVRAMKALAGALGASVDDLLP